MGPRVVVIGGGVLGSMHALFAVEAGCDVLMIEREDAPRGASVRNFGLVWVSGRRSGDELRLALRARALWEEIAERVPGVRFRANGSLTIAQGDDEVRVLRQVMDEEDSATRALSLLDPDDVRRLNPAVRGDVLAGLHCAADAAVEPREVPGALRDAMQRSGRFELLPGRHVVAVGDGWARDHTGACHEGDSVIVCTGANYRGFSGWAAESAGLHRVRLQMLETEPFELEVTTSIADGDSLRYYPVFDVPARAELHEPSELVREHGIQLLLQQRVDGALTIGDTHWHEEPFDVATFDEPYAHLVRRAESILGAELPPVRRRWAGVYSQGAPDLLYHFERIGERTSVVTGAGGRGMTMSPGIAEAVLTQLGLRDAAIPA